MYWVEPTMEISYNSYIINVLSRAYNGNFI